ncbi:MAG: hypothetical protein JKY37_00555, partial [Nannocystaceae bacterium]|nr:hypothetical protein [Nannocystaceae bacterium]
MQRNATLAAGRTLLAGWLAAWLTPAATARAHPVDEEPAGSPYAGRLTLYLNRCDVGLSVQPGEVSDSTQDVSSLLSDTVVFFPYPHGQTSWDGVLGHVRGLLRPFDIEVTDVDPSPAPHDEVVVCGNALEAGYAGLPGAAALRCEPSQNPMSFVFAEDAPARDRERRIAELVVQEAAHAWSLDHVVGCADLMGFDTGCGPKTLVDAELDCGTDTVKICACGGKEQNSYHTIAALFGIRSRDDTPPEASITSPSDAAVVEQGDTVVVEAIASDDFAIAEVVLLLDEQPIAALRRSTSASWPVSGLSVGPHVLQLEATDHDGNTARSESVTLEVQVAPLGDSSADDASSGETSGETSDDWAEADTGS